MLPIFATFNAANMLLGDLILLGSHFMAPRIRSNRYNILFGQFRIRRFTMRMPALPSHIRNIFQLGSFYEMGGVATRRIIACMQDVLVGCQRTFRELIHDAMGPFGSIVNANSSISETVSRCRPQPTIFGFVNVSQQTGHQRNSFSGSAVTLKRTELAAGSGFRFK